MLLKSRESNALSINYHILKLVFASVRLRLMLSNPIMVKLSSAKFKLQHIILKILKVNQVSDLIVNTDTKWCINCYLKL